MNNYRISIASENALLIYADSPISTELSQTLMALAQSLKLVLGDSVIDTTISYNSVLLTYNFLSWDYLAIKKVVETCLEQQLQSKNQAKQLELPIYYHTEVGPDLTRLAKSKQITTTELIKLHSQTLYSVYAVGFAPGFAFLGQVPELLTAPRLATPRNHVAKGALGIADRQTAIYPAQSPGGWNIIGNCPTNLFDASATPPIAMAIGDTIKFEPIERNEFIRLGGEL